MRRISAHVLVGADADELPDHQAVQRHPDLVELLDLLHRHVRDTRTPPRRDVDQPLLLEQEQRLAHRRAARLEARGELDRIQVGAGTELPVGDVPRDVRRDLADERLPALVETERRILRVLLHRIRIDQIVHGSTNTG
ncbi:MAG: hypothetical protein WDN44_03725 [Sphingomonas sp.]